MLSRKIVSLGIDYDLHKQLKAMDAKLEVKRLEVEKICNDEILFDCQHFVRRFTKILEGTSIRRGSLYTKAITS